MVRSLLLLVVGVASTVDVCPGSKSSTHSKTILETTFPKNSCAEVKQEMKSRVLIDPSFRITGDEDGDPLNMQGERMTFSVDRGDDKFGFYYKETNIDYAAKSKAHPRGCVLTGCGEKQTRSYDDSSTNYCGMRNLYCGSKKLCEYLHHDMEFKEKIETSLHSSTDLAACGTGGAAMTFSKSYLTKPSEYYDQA